MHSNMICINLAFQLDQQMLTSPDKNKESQSKSTAARYSQALSKLAWKYLQTLRFGQALAGLVEMDVRGPR